MESVYFLVFSVQRLGLDDMIADERYSSNQKRVENRLTLVERFSQRYIYALSCSILRFSGDLIVKITKHNVFSTFKKKLHRKS